MRALRAMIMVLIWPFGIGIASCLAGYIGTFIWAEIFGPPSLAEQGPPFLGIVAGLIGLITLINGKCLLNTTKKDKKAM